MLGSGSQLSDFVAASFLEISATIALVARGTERVIKPAADIHHIAPAPMGRTRIVN